MTIDVSIVIVAYRASATIASCLASIRRQKTKAVYEIILVNSSVDDTERIVRSQFPEVELVQLNERRFPGDARNIAIRRASGRLVAFIDADCVAEPGWLEGILRAHATHPQLGIGGAIGNNPGGLVSWASVFSEFSDWLQGLPDRETGDIAAASMTYKRELFDRFDPFKENAYCSDTEFHARMQRDGCPLLFTSDFRISHTSIDDLARYIRHEFSHGRSFGDLRIRHLGFGPARRVIYAAASPLIIVKLVALCVIRVWRSRYKPGKFLACFPFLIAGLAAWVSGEVAAYVDPRRGRGLS